MSCWWNDPAEVAQLLRWLEDRGTIASVDEAIAVVEKPWKWTLERTDMLSALCMENAA